MTELEKIEFNRCKNDTSGRYFIEKYLLKMIGEKSHLYPQQSDFLNVFNKNKFIIGTKYRQCGLTTILCDLATYMLLFPENLFKDQIKIYFGSANIDSNEYIIKKIASNFKNLPSFFIEDLNITINRDKISVIKYKWNKKSISYVSTSYEGLVDVFISDEQAFSNCNIPDNDGLLSNIIISTPNNRNKSQGKDFLAKYEDALKPNKDFVFTKNRTYNFYWWLNDKYRYELTWMKILPTGEIKKYSDDQILTESNVQEYITWSENMFRKGWTPTSKAIANKFAAPQNGYINEDELYEDLGILILDD